MISSILTLIASPLLLQAQTGVTCKNKDFFQTKIQVDVTNKPVNYLRGESLLQLQKRLSKHLHERQQEMETNYYTSDTDNPDSMDLAISGTTSGDIRVNTDIKFRSLPQDAANRRYCIMYEDVRVSISYQTNMRIAKELQPGGCAYDAVLAHQMKHHDANVKVVESVADKLREDLPGILTKLERNYVHKGDLRPSYDEMISQVQQVVDVYQTQIDELIKEYGAFIDTPEELSALANSCQ